MKKFKIKKLLNILGTKYKTKHVKVNSIELGLCDRASKTITINHHSDDQEYKHTVLHEMIHAALWESGLSQTMSLEVEEVLCTIIPTIILANVDIIDKSKNVDK